MAARRPCLARWAGLILVLWIRGGRILQKGAQMAGVNYGWQPNTAHDRMQLRIAGWIVELQVSPTGFASAVRETYAPFLVSPLRYADLVVEVRERAGARRGSYANSISLLQGRLTLIGGGILS